MIPALYAQFFILILENGIQPEDIYRGIKNDQYVLITFPIVYVLILFIFIGADIYNYFKNIDKI